MKTAKSIQRDELNERHAADPQPGDYWSEMVFCPVLVVLARTGAFVHICDGKKYVDRDHWTWDFRKLKTLTLDQFRKRLSYGTIPGFWCDVSPRSHMWAVKELETSPRWPEPESAKAPPVKKIPCSQCAGSGEVYASSPKDPS